MIRLSLIPLALVLSAASANAGTPPPPTISTSATQTQAFVGLNWTFGAGGGGAEGVLGVARVKTDSDGKSEGAKLSVHMPLSNGLSFGKVKLTGMMGNNDGMGEIGVGFGTGGAFGTAGLWAPFLNAGVDVGFDGSFGGYAGAHTLDAWDIPAELSPDT